MTYLSYRNDIEIPEEDEQASIDGIIQEITQESETVEKRQGHAVRASHAKSTACVIGELDVPADLPPELTQGLFVTPGTYLVAVRFARDPGGNLGDRVSTHRGMAIKVFEVEGSIENVIALDDQDGGSVRDILVPPCYCSRSLDTPLHLQTRRARREIKQSDRDTRKERWPDDHRCRKSQTPHLCVSRGRPR